MRTTFVSVFALLLISCSSPEERTHRTVMDQIEEQVDLPNGARPLADYSRYYADSGNGEVIAVYVIIPKDKQRPDEACEQLDANFTGHIVRCEPMRFPWAIPAGQRRWLRDKRDLPFMNGGGCGQIEVNYNKAKAAVTLIECNGPN